MALLISKWNILTTYSLIRIECQLAFKINLTLINWMKAHFRNIIKCWWEPNFWNKIRLTRLWHASWHNLKERPFGDVCSSRTKDNRVTRTTCAPACSTVASTTPVCASTTATGPTSARRAIPAIHGRSNARRVQIAAMAPASTIRRLASSQRSLWALSASPTTLFHARAHLLASLCRPERSVTARKIINAATTNASKDRSHATLTRIWRILGRSQHRNQSLRRKNRSLSQSQSIQMRLHLSRSRERRKRCAPRLSVSESRYLPSSLILSDDS